MSLFDDICREITTHIQTRHQLTVDENFVGRQQALAAINLFKAAANPVEHARLYQQARELETQIHHIEANIQRTYRRRLLADAPPPAEIRRILNCFTNYTAGTAAYLHYAPDNLDRLIDGLFDLDVDAARLPDKRPDMVQLERSPASVILELIDHLELRAGDVIYELGAGLGHALLLMGLLTKATCIGVEIETAYCQTLQNRLTQINLPQVSVINRDIRAVNLSNGDVFYMFTPCTGPVFQDVLAALKQVAAQKRITVASFGQSTLTLGQVPWLTLQHGDARSLYRATIFNSG